MRLFESDFITQQSYDAGHFPATESPVPIFSKQFWKSLVHETRTPEDRISILSSRKVVCANPNILPGVYTQPDAWLSWEVPEDKKIEFKLRQTKFAHNGSDRPMDSLNGYGSLWWNILYCNAARRIGIDLQPTDKAEDIDWCRDNEDAISMIRDFTNPNCKRELWTKAMTVELRNAGIDVLGNGGEFIILNPVVIDWDRTREASGFVSKAQKSKEKLEARFAAVEGVIRTIVMCNRSRGVLAFGMARRVVTKRAIVLTNMILPTSSLAEDFFRQVAEVAKENNIKLGLDDSTDVAGHPTDYGFSKGADGKYWHA